MKNNDTLQLNNTLLWGKDQIRNVTFQDILLDGHGVAGITLRENGLW